jgi:hypothetical protein
MGRRRRWLLPRTPQLNLPVLWLGSRSTTPGVAPRWLPCFRRRAARRSEAQVRPAAYLMEARCVAEPSAVSLLLSKPHLVKHCRYQAACAASVNPAGIAAPTFHSHRRATAPAALAREIYRLLQPLTPDAGTTPRAG